MRFPLHIHGRARALPAGLAVAALLVAPAAARGALAPPPVTGHAPVGLVRMTLHDRHDHNPLVPGGRNLIPLRVWYPAAHPGSAPGPALTVAEQVAYESAFQLPAHSLDGMGASTTAAPPPAAGRHPVLLLSHGVGGSSAFHTAQATDLASHGYVVIGIDLPGDATVVDVGGGKLVTINPKGEGFVSGHGYEPRIADMRYVLSHLGRVHGAGRLDRSRVGVFGHSLGASAVAGAMLADRRLRAGVMLDGVLGPKAAPGTIRRPVGLAWGDHPLNDPFLVATRKRLRGPHPFRHFATTGHAAFTDFVWMVRQLHIDPVAAGIDVGTVRPRVAVRDQRAFLRHFFAHHLR
jgi:dienelactone hydrolase